MPLGTHDAHYKYCDLFLVQRDGVSLSQTRSGFTSWNNWLNFCACLTFAPYLTGVTNSIPYLQIFAERVRIDALAVGSTSTHKLTAE